MFHSKSTLIRMGLAIAIAILVAPSYMAWKRQTVRSMIESFVGWWTNGPQRKFVQEEREAEDQRRNAEATLEYAKLRKEQEETGGSGLSDGMKAKIEHLRERRQKAAVELKKTGKLPDWFVHGQEPPAEPNP